MSQGPFGGFRRSRPKNSEPRSQAWLSNLPDSAYNSNAALVGQVVAAVSTGEESPGFVEQGGR